MASNVDNLIPSVWGWVRISDSMVADDWNTFEFFFPSVRLLDMIKRKNKAFIINAISVLLDRQLLFSSIKDHLLQPMCKNPLKYK